MKKTKTSESVKPWVRTILILPAFIIIIVGLFQLAGMLILGLNPTDRHLEKTALQEMIGAVFTLLGTCTTVGVFRRFIDQESFRSMGFYPKNVRSELLIGIGLGILIMTTGFISLIGLQEIAWVKTNFDFLDIIYGVVLFALVAFTEELLMRGYVLNNLMKSMHRLLALLVSAVMFSAMHVFNDNFSWIGFTNIVLAGILLGLPYVYTQSLWLPIALHFSWNFFQGIIFGFNVSGHVTYSLFTQSRTADTIWNGGKFGFEGSVLSIVFQLIAIGGLWWYYNQKTADSMNKVPEPINVPVEKI